MKQRKVINPAEILKALPSSFATVCICMCKDFAIYVFSYQSNNSERGTEVWGRVNGYSIPTAEKLHSAIQEERHIQGIY